MKLVTNQSDLSADPDTAAWLFESAQVDTGSDPLNILLQREMEDELDDMVLFARQYRN